MEELYIDYEKVKNKELRDLENIACDELTKKIKELNDIVADIEENWHGAKAKNYRKQIDNIIEAIESFKKNYLLKNISDINEQVNIYKAFEENEGQ